MSQQIIVDRDIEFRGVAYHTANVKGNMLPERMTSVDWFDQRAIDTTYDYTSTLDGTSDAVALTAGGTNGVTMTTGTTDNEVSFLATGLIFDITQKPTIESKIQITDVSGTFVYFGFSDATSETTPAATIDADSGTFTAAATNAVGFVIDADYQTSSLVAASVNAGGTVQTKDTGIDYTDGQSKILRVEIDASGNASFFVDGLQEAYIALAVADVPLCAIYNYGTRDNDGANTVIARYLAKFQDMP